MEREIKKPLKELDALDRALLDDAVVVVLAMSAFSESLEDDPGSVVQVTWFDALRGVTVGGLAAGGGGVQRQPLELMTPANSATWSSSSLLR